MHEEFLEQLEEQKLWKQLMFAAEKEIEMEERERRQKEEVRFNHSKLKAEQQALEEELTMLAQFYT